MARKAKLDILEINTEIHTEVQPVDQESLQTPKPDPGSQQRPLRARLNKRLIITCGIVISVCFIAGGGVLFWMGTAENNGASMPGKPRPAAATDVTRQNVANLDNFVIDYREQGDTVRIAIFALAVELNEPVRKDAVENQPELRGDIYTLSKRRSIGSLRSLEERGALRNEIAAELEKRLGAGAVKAVYFTKFYIL